MDQRPKDAEYEAKLAALHAALKAGMDSGPAEPFDVDAFLAEIHAQHPE